MLKSNKYLIKVTIILCKAFVIIWLVRNLSATPAVDKGVARKSMCLTGANLLSGY